MRNNKITEINRRLLQAARVGNVEDIRALIGGGAEVNFKDSDGENALLHAAHCGREDRYLALDAIRVLLAHGASVDIQDNEGWSALMYASFIGHTDAVRVLLSRGASVNILNDAGWSALILASMSGHTDTIRVLLAHGTGVDTQDNDGYTALMHAAWNGHDDSVRELIDGGASLEIAANVLGRTAVISASEMGYTVVEKLIKSRLALLNNLIDLLVRKLKTKSDDLVCLLNKMLDDIVGVSQSAKDGVEDVIKRLLNSGLISYGGRDRNHDNKEILLIKGLSRSVFVSDLHQVFKQVDLCGELKRSFYSKENTLPRLFSGGGGRLVLCRQRQRVFRCVQGYDLYSSDAKEMNLGGLGSRWCYVTAFLDNRDYESYTQVNRLAQHNVVRMVSRSVFRKIQRQRTLAAADQGTRSGLACAGGGESKSDSSHNRGNSFGGVASDATVERGYESRSARTRWFMAKYSGRQRMSNPGGGASNSGSNATVGSRIGVPLRENQLDGSDDSDEEERRYTLCVMQ